MCSRKSAEECSLLWRDFRARCTKANGTHALNKVLRYDENHHPQTNRQRVLAAMRL